ncbi:unnamed protein product [Ceratitis capitata]|uniref:(Mediterranean fruit fly) hypothetical protein n=1 Tax=Ceratitis capitata TaxID=7213 RepID=A0A811UDQ7_CERCA|nr:unnamed protein product [Ceratitis capitata]
MQQLGVGNMYQRSTPPFGGTERQFRVERANVREIIIQSATQIIPQHDSSFFLSPIMMSTTITITFVTGNNEVIDKPTGSKTNYRRSYA